MNIKKTINAIRFQVRSAINALCLIKIKIKTGILGAQELKIIFICQVPSLWNSIKPVFEEALRRKITVFLLAVPEKRVGKDYSVKDEIYEENKAYDFCKEFYDSVIDAYDANKNKWFDIASLRPDYVFLPRPYDIHLPPIYRSNRLARYTRLCYINYAYNYESYADTFIYKREFIKNIYFLFPESKYSEKFINDVRAKNHIAWNKVRLFGYPRFALLKKNGVATKGKKVTILWTPRWTTNKDVCGSHFFEYRKRLFSFITNNSNYKLIFRPHPLLFRNFLSTGELSLDEYHELLQEIENQDNITLDESGDYVNAFSESDVLITDTSGLLIDYYVTEKPIIFCGEKRDFSDNFLYLHNSLYDGTTWSGVEKSLRDIALSDRYFEARKRNISSISPYVDSSRQIIECILQDYALNKGRE